MRYAALLLGLCFILSGCVVRTYTMTKDRVDQNLSEGNKGYLMGQGPTEEKVRTSTRDTQVLEIEFGKNVKTKKSQAASPAVQEPIREEPVMENVEPVSVEPEAPACEQYKVQKGDTLQKISEKFYGTTKKWNKIFETNRDKMKAPDKIYPGKTICLPTDGLIKTKEPTENLK